jgi:integrase
MPAKTLALFDEPLLPDVSGYLAAFDNWLATRQRAGVLREHSSAAVYRSMWGALAAWCVARDLRFENLEEAHFDAYIESRGGVDTLTPRHAWRLLMLADAVLAHRANQNAVPHNAAAHTLLMARPDWRYANAAAKTPLPEHLDALQARRLVAWLLDPSIDALAAAAPAQVWQSQRNRTAVALQLGAGLTPGDIRAATVDGVLSRLPASTSAEAAPVAAADAVSSASASGTAEAPALPWKIRLPAHGAMLAREAPIAPWASGLLRSWLDIRSTLGFGGSALFPSTRGGRCWGKVSQYGAAKAVLAAAGLPDNEGGSFRLRHTFALRQLRRGSPPEQVAQWLGLSDTTALARYQRMLVDAVMQA